MGKRSIAVVAILGGLYLGATAWTGASIEKHYTRLHDEVPEQPGISFGELEYSRGLFSAEASRELVFDLYALTRNEELEGRTLTLRLEDSISHGPLAGGLRLAAAHVESRLYGEGAADAAPLGEARTLITYGGRYRGQLWSEPGQLPEGAELHGLEGSYAGGLRDNSFVYRVAMAHLLIPVRGENDVAVEIRDALLEAEGHFIPESWTSTGDATVRIGRFAVRAGDEDGFVVEDMLVAGDTVADGELLSTDAHIEGRFQTLDGRHDGDFSMELSLKNIHHGDLQALVQAQQAMPPELLEAPMAQLEHLDAPLRKLLSHDPVYAIENARIRFDDLSADFDLRFATRGSAEAPALFPLVMLLAQHGEVQGRARMPAQWVMAAMLGQRDEHGQPRHAPEDLDAQIQALAQTGYLTLDSDDSGSYLASRIDYVGGELRINGQAFPPQPHAHAH